MNKHRPIEIRISGIILAAVAAGFLFFSQGRGLAQTASKTAAKSGAKPDSAKAACETKTVLPTEDTVNSFLLQTFGYDASLSWKVGDIRPSEVQGLAEISVVITGPQGPVNEKFLITPDGKHFITGDLAPFGAKPFEEARVKLEKGVNGISKGPAKASVLIVEFSDMQCPHCAKAAPNVEQLIAQEPDARFVFQNYPLPMHNWAEKGAEYVDCVGRASSDAVWKFIDKTFEDQSNITESNVDEKLQGIATAAGVKGDEIAACVAKPDTKARVEASMALGKSVDVNATPTLFINGRAVSPAAPVDVLKKIVDFAASQAKGGASGNGGN
jgi:protein-disulfide isomerase